LGWRSLIVLAYCVFPYSPAAASGSPGHPVYEHKPQRGGRIDHPDYYVWYLAVQPEAATGEVFGNLAVWDDSMFLAPMVPAGRRTLGVYHLPDDLRVLDLDDPAELTRLSLRATQIVVRNLAVTQAWGHRIWSERDPHDPAQRRWQALKWWSYRGPTWDIIACWERPALDHVEHLDLRHPAIREAAAALHRPLP
jgi:hypothetical protein